MNIENRITDHVAALGNAVGPDAFFSFPQTLEEFSLVAN
jgi:hypothetical protein